MQHSAAEADAALARARVRAASVARDRALRAWSVGLLRQAPRALPARDPPRDAALMGLAGRDKGRFRGCRSPAAGRSYRDLPGAAGRDVPGALAAPRRSKGEPDERPRRHSRHHPPLARRDRQRRRSARQMVVERLERGAARRDPAARTGLGRCAARPVQVQAEAALATVDGGRDPLPTCRNRSPTSCAITICRRRLRMGDDPRLRAMPWSDTALEIAHGPSAGQRSQRRQPRLRRRGRDRLAGDDLGVRTIRPPSTSCRTTTSS